ncbi:MAG: hypothetical protein Q8J66_09380 [Methylotenera sp.]|nr:hypothetical protein [Methylotenera sp.]
MKEPKCSTNGSCPSCDENKWKLAKMILISKLARHDVNFQGEGFEVRLFKESGLKVSYQGQDIETKDKNLSFLVEYFPPELPLAFKLKEKLIEQCHKNIEDSAKAIVKAENFAKNSVSVKPGLFDGFSVDISLSAYKDNFDKAFSKLVEIQEYELKKAIWDKTKVCLRCGECYISANIKKNIETFELPKFTFTGMEKYCPSCKSYVWKNAERYYSIPIINLKSQLSTSQNLLKDSIKFYNQPPEKGILTWISRYFFKPESPDLLEKVVVKAQAILKRAIDEHKSISEKNDNLLNMKICLKCKNLYH